MHATSASLLRRSQHEHFSQLPMTSMGVSAGSAEPITSAATEPDLNVGSAPWAISESLRAAETACFVSVVVPVFNKAPFLSACLDSILSQTIKEIEVICVDDASTDSSSEILDVYAEKDARVRVIRSSINLGAGKCRNIGIAVASSPYVQFTDADDLLPSHALEVLYRRAVDDGVPIVRGSVGGFRSLHADEAEPLSEIRDQSSFVPLSEQALWTPWWHTSYLISKDFLIDNAIGYPGLSSGEDPVFLAAVLAAAPRMSSVSCTTYLYRIAAMEGKARANFKNLSDYIEHARAVKRIFAGQRSECWSIGYGPHVRQDIEALIQRYRLSDDERLRLHAQARNVFSDRPVDLPKILFVYRVCGLGGVETSILNKLEALRRRGALAKVLFLGFWGEGGRSIAERPDVHVMPERASQLELLQQGWTALIVVDTPEFLSVAAEAGIRCPVFFETHASYLPALARYHSNVHDPVIAGVIAPSQFNKRLLMDGGCADERVKVIPNVIEKAAFATEGEEDFCVTSLPTDVPLILSIGRLEPQKNTLEFVGIARALLAANSVAHFVVVGDAVDSGDYAAQVHDAVPAQYKDCFTFVPRVGYENMAQLYSRSAQSGGCLIVTSLNESQPMIVLEAMVCGCPVVASDVGGIRETVFDSETGFLYPSGDIDSATAAVRRLLEDKDARVSIVRQASDLLRLEHSSSRTADFYMALTDNSDTGPAEARSDFLGPVARNGSPAVLSQAAVKQMAARVDALVAEFVSLHMAMLHGGTGASCQNAIAALFSDPVLEAAKAPVKAYADVAPGVQVGFEPTSTVLLTVQAKQDFSLSPDRCLNTATIEFSGTSRWLTLELAIAWEEFKDATRYQFGLYARPNRPLTGHAALRLPLKSGGTVDRRLSDFIVPEAGRNCHRSGVLTLPDMAETDLQGRPRLIFFFDPTSDLTLRLDYLTVYFA